MDSVPEAKPSMRVFLGSQREVRSVRAFVGEAVNGCPAADDVILLASEVSANAIVHTASGKGGTFTVVVHPLDGMVRVEVHDGGSETPPDIRSADEQAVSGRGLGLVELLAARWGHLGDQDGRVVWFEVDLPPCPSPSLLERRHTMQDSLSTSERTHLERLKLAADILLSEHDAIPDSLEAELTVFRDRVEHALLLPGQAGQ